MIAAGLAAVAALAWVYLWRGAGMGMSAIDMTTLSLFPHRQADVMGEMDSTWPVIVAMWWVMMIAMMTPSAAPLVLLYGLVLRRHAAPGHSAYLPSLLLLAGYLVVWLAFAVAAAALQKALQPAGLLSAMMLSSKSAALSAAVLAAAGLYQLSDFKHTCLAQCRDPVRFLTEHWRPGRFGSFVLGVRHGAYCVGCCWGLMVALFALGVMSLTWMAVVAAIIFAQKVLPAGERLTRVFAVTFIAAGIWVAAAPGSVPGLTDPREEPPAMQMEMG